VEDFNYLWLKDNAATSTVETAPVDGFLALMRG
jgi:hypothetical protein